MSCPLRSRFIRLVLAFRIIASTCRKGFGNVTPKQLFGLASMASVAVLLVLALELSILML